MATRREKATLTFGQSALLGAPGGRALAEAVHALGGHILVTAAGEAHVTVPAENEAKMNAAVDLYEAAR